MLTKKQLEEDVQFLRRRARKTGAYVGDEKRSWGTSSNAIVDFAYGGPWPNKKTQMPYDQSDLDACERAVKLLPKHRRTPEVLRALQNARDALAKRREKSRLLDIEQAALLKAKADRFELEEPKKESKRLTGTQV